MATERGRKPKQDMDIYYPGNGVEELTNYLMEHGERRRVGKGTALVEEDSASDELFLLRRGVAKSVCTDYKGRERILTLTFEGELMGSYLPARLNQPSPFGIITLEDSLVYSIHLHEHQAFFEHCVEGRRYVRAFTEYIAHTHLMHYISESRLSPWQRLDDLLERVPDILLRLSRRDVAAYIGVTPEALSRHLSR